MYQPPLFKEERLDEMHALIRAHPFGLLVSAASSGLLANAVPFSLDAAASDKGTLRAHVARSNPHWKEFVGEGADCLVVFQGPDGYVTPSWYPTKGETGKVVPTWNYVMVQVRGRCIAQDDAPWIRAQVEALTSAQESGRAVPWKISDAPDDFIAMQMRAIVGLEIRIAAIEGKWKVSQNRTEADRRGVHAGFGGEGEAAGEIAALVAERGGFGKEAALADPALSVPRMTAKEYLELERRSSVRHEFVDGVVYSMTGTTKRHDLIGGDFFGALLNHLKPPYVVYTSNVKVHVESPDTEAYYYPDVHVSCSDLDNDALATEMPVLVIEVASESTSDYDRGAKFAAYRKLPSLQEYVIAQQIAPQVEVFRKSTGWQVEHFGSSDVFTLAGVGMTLPVAQFYRRVTF